MTFQKPSTDRYRVRHSNISKFKIEITKFSFQMCMYIFYFQFTDALHKLLWNATNSIETHETFVIVSVGNFPVFPGPRSTYNKCVRQLACLFLHLNLLFVPYFQWLLAITVIWRFFSLKALSFFLRNLPFDHEFGVGNAAVSVQIHFSEGPIIYYVST